MVRDKNGVPWSAEDMAQLDTMLADGCNAQQIGEALGRTPAAVTTKLHNIGRRIDGQPVQTRKAHKRRKSGAAFFLS
jgi:hypothetical protein